MKERQLRKLLSKLKTDIEERKCEYRQGFDTLLVHTVNYECLCLDFFRHAVIALNIPPENYVRKNKIQRNWRGLSQVVERVV